jgi:hypothetical protein
MKNIIDISSFPKFGKISVSKGFVTEDQLNKALFEQTANDPALRLRPHKLLGEIFFEKGWMNSKQIALVLHELVVT